MSDAPFTLDPSQEAAAELIATAPVGCVTGGPGTGKTTSLRTALDRLGAPVPVDLSADDPFDAAAQEGDLSAYRANRLPDPQIALCAPTGKAARRMSEATGRSASTIHRLLGYNGHSFRRDQDDPLDSRLVVVDEASMIDTMLMQALLRALRPETRLIMVGDADQLPSVGPGAIFSDLLDSGAVPSRRLITLHRAAQESWICQNGPRFIAGDSIDLAEERDDFQFVEVETAASAAEAVVDGLAQWDAEHADEHGELQVLIPMRKHALGTTAVNAAIHGVLSTRRGHAAKISGEVECFTGDKVINTRNNYQLQVMNGDIGTVLEVTKDSVVVDFECYQEPRRFSRKEAYDLELAWALTIHKAQGSEWPWVMVVCHSSQHYMLSRQLIYTAITRAKKGVILVGDRKGIDRALSNNRPAERRTRLQEALRGEED